MVVKKVESGKHNGEYRIRIQPIDPMTSRRISFPVQYASSKAKADQLERKLLSDFDNGYTYRKADKIFSDSFKCYIRSEFEAGRWGNGTYADWQYSGRIFEQYFRSTKIRDMNEEMVRLFSREFVKDHDVTVGRDSVISRRLTHMRAFFVPLVGESIKKNPVPERAIDKFFRKDEKAIKKEKYVLIKKESSYLKEVLRQKYKSSKISSNVSILAIWTALETGMRPQEVQALKWTDFKIEDGFHVFRINDAWNEREHKLNGHLKSRKIGETRITLPITTELFNIFNDFHQKQELYLNDKNIKNKNDFLFLSLNDFRIAALGRPIMQTSLNEMLIKTGKDANINPPKEKQWSMYSLRHSVATKLGNTPNMSYPWAADRMGHTLSEFMETYVHVDKDREHQMLKQWVAGV